MLRLSKKIEYAILAMQYMASHGSEKATAKELSEELNISFEFLSKALQSLMKAGLAESIQGIKGGYRLARPPEEISVADVITAMENRIGIVECIQKGKDGCGRAEDCTIRIPMVHLQKKIETIFDSTTIAELAKFQLVAEH